MEEKHPIRFSLAQFIILLGVGVVLLSLVFILGARFGGAVFPDFYARQFETKSLYQGLQPEKTQVKRGEEPPKSDKLVDTLDEEEDGSPSQDAPHFQVGSDGISRQVEQNGNYDSAYEEEEEDELTVNKSLMTHPAEKNTMVRFKSSGHSKFAIEVGEYFDELIASNKISQLKNKGYEAYLVINKPNSSSPTYAVRVGVFSDRQMADDFATQLSNRQGLELRVVHIN